MYKNKILVVDDSIETAELFQHMLSGEGYAVSVAHNGQEGLTKIKENNPDLVILDVMMPEMDGFQALNKLREDPSTKNIQVIMLTAKGLEEDVQKGIDLQVKDYISKPFHVGLLLKRIKRLLKTE